MNLADVVVLVVLACLTAVGLRRGLVGQVLLLAATLISLAVAVVAAYLVATEADAGHGLARLAAPLAFFLTLMVSSWLLKGLAKGITRVVHGLPFSSLDRLLGALISIAVGVVILSLLFLGLLSIDEPNPLTDAVVAARSTPWLLAAGGVAWTHGAGYIDLLAPLARRFEAATGRLELPDLPDIPSEIL
jgi:uncharacterized membrane protein required for colicin V production